MSDLARDNRWYAIVLVAAYLGMTALCIGLMVQRNTAESQRNEARADAAAVRAAIVRECVIGNDGSVSCPPKTINTFGILMSHPVPTTVAP